MFIDGGVVPEIVPSLGDSISEGTVVEWVKNVGDIVAADEVICVIETDKVSVDIRATVGGEIVELAAEEGDTIEVGGTLASIDTSKAGAAPAVAAGEPEAAATPAPAAATTTAAPTTAAPAAAAEKPAATPAKPDTPPAASAAPSKAAPGSREERRVPASRMRQTIAKVGVF